LPICLSLKVIEIQSKGYKERLSGYAFESSYNKTA
jgi:hypothetical protein